MRYLLTALFFAFLIHAHASTMTKLENLRYVEHPSNDGDSFRATDGTEEYYLRLYLVDTLESSAGDDTMAKRLREQTRYFGLQDYPTVIALAKEATEFTREQLAEPFTAYTTFAGAGGRSTVKRIYVYIITARGESLEELLVREGYARAYGIARENQDGVSASELRARVGDLEVSAMLKRKGAWKYSDPDKIAAMRQLERKELAELKKISAAVSGRPEGSLINVNSATAEELTHLSGIGKVTAERIIAGRPYASLEDLKRVQGIADKTLEAIEDQVEF